MRSKHGVPPTFSTCICQDHSRLAGPQIGPGMGQQTSVVLGVLNSDHCLFHPIILFPFEVRTVNLSSSPGFLDGYEILEIGEDGQVIVAPESALSALQQISLRIASYVFWDRR